VSGTMTLESVRGGIRPFVEWIEQSRPPSADEAADVRTHAAIPVFLLEQLWADVREMMNQGVEHRKIVAILGDLASMNDSCIRAFTEVQIQPGAREYDAAMSERLTSELSKLRELRSAVSSLLQWLRASPPPIDMSKLPKTSTERVSAGYISVEEMAARLRTDRP
jgi:hypothetical protein